MEKPAQIQGKGRTTWTKRVDFVFNLVGMVVGLGNVWRFPYLCFKNGGGTFLIPYFLLVLLVVFPLIILESSVGQFTGSSALKAWMLVPLMRGIGLASTVIVIYSNICYPILLTWALRWLVATFSTTLPWMTCDNEWNTENCASVLAYYQNGTSIPTIGKSHISNYTLAENSTTSVEQFWMKHILGISSGLEEIGEVRLDLAGCLFAIWILTYFSVWKGIGWTSKIVYVTATLPFIMLLVVMVRGLTLKGAAEGIRFYLNPDLTKLLEVEVWTDASSQVMYTFALGFGAITTLSGYNKFQHNFKRDCIILVFANMIASFLAGFAIFSVLGYLAHHQNTTVDKVVDSGPGLVFIVYPTAMSLLPLPQLWCGFFFLMIIFLGFDGQFIFQETFYACLKDAFPKRLNRRWSREITLAFASVLMFLPGIAMVTRGGIYVFEIFNQYAFTGWCLFSIAFCEFVTIGWMYGADKMCDNMKLMGQTVPRLWFKSSWKFVGPVVALAITIYSLSKQEGLKYGRSYSYPTWANVFGVMMGMSSLLMIPAYAICTLWSSQGDTLLQKFTNSIETPQKMIEKEEMKMMERTDNHDGKA